MTIGIVHPDSGNITSICDCLARLKLPYRLLKAPDLDGIRHLLLPGQGRFGAVMRFLRQSGWDLALKNWHAGDRPILGICVGMQVLFESSSEDPDEPGLGLLPGAVQRLPAPKLPMIGWAQVRWRLPDFPDGAAYFVNSYGVLDHPDTAAETHYGQTYSVAVAKGTLLGMQFHPEKSSDYGKELLQRCLTC